MDEDRRERIRYYTFAAFVGVLLLLNWLGLVKTVFGLDTAIPITLLAGYKTFHNSISALLERRISADIALCIAVIAAFSVGQYLAAAEAMFIVLVGEGLESYAAGRTAAAIERFVEQMPRRARGVGGGAGGGGGAAAPGRGAGCVRGGPYGGGDRALRGADAAARAAVARWRGGGRGRRRAGGRRFHPGARRRTVAGDRKSTR